MNLIRALGLTDSTSLKFPVGLYTSKDILRGGHPFAVLYIEGGQPKLRVGDTAGKVNTHVVID